jgi:hypothetical protein
MKRLKRIIRTIPFGQRILFNTSFLLLEYDSPGYRENGSILKEFGFVDTPSHTHIPHRGSADESDDHSGGDGCTDDRRPVAP